MSVSVIIPTYNRADRVIAAIQSVQHQTYSKKQIIVIDDGSRDDTKQQVGNLSGVEYYYQENSRQAAARNHGLKHAQGKYIATLDSDDVWEKNFLSESARCLEKHDLDFVFSSWLIQKDGKIFPNIWENSGIFKKYLNKPWESWFLLDAKEVREIFVKSCPAPSSSLLIKRDSMVSVWNTNLKIADDWGLILDMVLAKPCRAAFTFMPLWQKNVHHENIYDGQSRKKISSDLQIHDTRLLKQRYFSKLTFGEKSTLNLRIAKGIFIRAAYFLKNFLRIKKD